MKTKMQKLAIAFCLIFSCAMPVLARGTSPIYKGTQIKRQGNSTEINIKIDLDNRNAPLEELYAATKNWPQIQQVKVSWSFIGGGLYRGTAVYNRSKATIHLYVIETVEENAYRHYRIYTLVSSSALYQTARLHRTITAHDDGIEPLSFFNELTRYGCKEKKVSGYWYKLHR